MPTSKLNFITLGRNRPHLNDVLTDHHTCCSSVITVWTRTFPVSHGSMMPAEPGRKKPAESSWRHRLHQKLQLTKLNTGEIGMHHFEVTSYSSVFLKHGTIFFSTKYFGSMWYFLYRWLPTIDPSNTSQHQIQYSIVRHSIARAGVISLIIMQPNMSVALIYGQCYSIGLGLKLIISCTVWLHLLSAWHIYSRFFIIILLMWMCRWFMHVW